MNAPAGIGFISFAHGHVAAYARVLKDVSGAKLVIAHDPMEERGRPLCEETGMTYTPHLEDVLNHPEVQAVIIGSETCYHAEHAVAAAQAGKHILLQKPMALTLADCDRIIEAVDRAGVHFSMAFQMRHDPANIRMREIVQAGELGPLAMVRRRHCIPVCLMPEFINSPAHWHLEADKNKGMFADDAAHPADWFHWTFGKPVSVIAEIDNVITDVAPDDNGVAVYRFESGMMGILFNGSTMLAGENTTEIYGLKGCVIQNYGDGPSSTVPRLPDGPPLKTFLYGQPEWRVEPIPFPEGGQGERIMSVPVPWLERLLADSEPHASAADGRIALEMTLAAYRAAETGQRVTFPFTE